LREKDLSAIDVAEDISWQTMQIDTLVETAAIRSSKRKTENNYSTMHMRKFN
jgi:hypothetical protein